MRVLTLCLAIGIMLTAACGGGSSSNTSGAGGAGGSLPPPTGTCANLTCLNPMMSLIMNCMPSGSCTEQVSTTGAVNMCYSNGVKMQGLLDMASMSSMTMTVKNGSGVCYTMVVGGFAATTTAMTITIKNSSGATVGTMGIDSTTNSETVTCPGGTATVIDSSCGGDATSAASSASSASSATCTQGTCTY